MNLNDVAAITLWAGCLYSVILILRPSWLLKPPRRVLPEYVDYTPIANWYYKRYLESHHKDEKTESLLVRIEKLESRSPCTCTCTSGGMK